LELRSLKLGSSKKSPIKNRSDFCLICPNKKSVRFLKLILSPKGFKYKKEVPKIDNDLKAQMKDYIKVRL
jgi:hypothetical protein